MSADPAPFTDFAVHVAPTEHGTDVAIFGELDLATLEPAREAFDQALEAPGEVVLDLRACPFMDSKGVGLIAQAAVRLQREGRTFILRGVQERVARILDISGLTKSDLMQVERQPKA